MNKKEKKYTQRYNKTWEKDPDLISWLGSDPTGCTTRAYCKYCKCSLIAHKKDLINHCKSAKHERQVRYDKEAKLDKYVNLTSNSTNAQKKAELKLSIHIAEHSSINTINHLCELLPSIDPSSTILSNLKLHRTKCTMLLKNVIAPCMLLELVEDVGDSLFSIIVDESTDVTSDKVLCVMIKYYSVKRKEIVTTFYRMILLERCDAESLFTVIKSQLTNDKLELKNLFGIGVDGANVMVGQHHSFTTLLKREVPDAIIIKCICHSLHLCAEKACKVLPKRLEFFVREVHNYFSHSPKRITEYRNLYLQLKGQIPNKVAKLSGTRWLARNAAIRTILTQWDALYLFFKRFMVEDGCYMAEQLYLIMDCPAYKAYLVFLKDNLETVCRTNMVFQSDNTPFLLFEDIFMLYKSMLQKIVMPRHLESITDAQLTNFNFEQHIMHVDSVYYGHDFDIISKTIKKDDILDVKSKCRQFLITICKELQHRLTANIDILQKIRVFMSATATSQKKIKITDIVQQFSRFSVEHCQSEWDLIANKVWNETEDYLQFWTEVYNDKNSAGKQRFENISRLALGLLSLPISNATVERAFSTYNIIKCKLRNRLSLDVAEAIMTTRYYLKSKNLTCVDFEPTASMIKKFNTSMYDDNDLNSKEILELFETI